MFKIYDGRSHFYQWDIDRKLIVEDASISEVHFCNQTDKYSLVCKTYIEDGLNLVNVPNILLQNDWRINVYAYDSNYTKFSERFDVIQRCKPEDYVYTETEILNYNTLSDRITKIEEGGGITPTIGENGNWFLGDTDTNKPSRGKSAYSYAVDGGYTGTEAEFAAKLAAEGLDKALFVVNITSNGDGTYSANKTFAEIVQVYNEGKYNIVANFAVNAMNTFIIPFLNIMGAGAAFGGVVDLAYFTLLITPNNEVQMQMAPLATLKDTLPNPYPLTFTGAVNETYDGSSAKTIEIPSGGGGSGSYFGVYTVEENVSEYRIPFDVSRYRRIVISVNQASSPTSLTIGFVIDGLSGSTVKEGGVSSRTCFMFDIIEWTPGTLANGGKYELFGYSRRNNNPDANTLLNAGVQYVTTEENSLLISGNDGVVISQGTIITITAIP